jgi:hypothetical protein
MKKNLSIILIILSIIVCFSACEKEEKIADNDDKSTEYVSKMQGDAAKGSQSYVKEYDTYYNLKHTLEEYDEDLSKMFDTSLLKEQKNASSLYDSQDHVTECYIYNENGTYIEIASVKLKDSSELMWALGVANSRATKLKEENKKLAEEDNIIIEVNQGVLTLVAATENASRISEDVTAFLK